MRPDQLIMSLPFPPIRSMISGQLSLLEEPVDQSVEQAKDFSTQRDKERQPRLASSRGKPQPKP